MIPKKRLLKDIRKTSSTSAYTTRAKSDLPPIIEVTSKRSTREKLIAHLLLQSKKSHSNCFEIPCNRQELTDYLEVDRSGLSVEIGKLCRQGVITAERNRFQLIVNIV